MAGPKAETPIGSAAEKETNEDNGGEKSEVKSEDIHAIPLQPFDYKRHDGFKTWISSVERIEKMKVKWALNMLEQFYMFATAFGFDSDKMAKNPNLIPGYLKNDATHPKRVAVNGSFHRIKERIAKIVKDCGSYTEMFPFLSMPDAADPMQKIVTDEQKKHLWLLQESHKITLRLSAFDEAMEKHRCGTHIVTINVENVAQTFASLLGIATCSECVEQFCQIRVQFCESSPPELKVAFNNLDIVRAVSQSFLDAVVGYQHPKGTSKWNENPLICTKFSFDLSNIGIPIWKDDLQMNSASVEDVLKLKKDVSEEASAISVGPANTNNEEPIVTDNEIEDPSTNLWASVLSRTTSFGQASENVVP